MNKGLRHAFTMIELIFVIIILGILAVTALPRFVGVQDDAKISTEQGTIGAVRGAIAISHSKWLINQGTALDWDSDGTPETFSTQGYLTNLETGGTAASANAAATTGIFAEILSEPATDWARIADAVDATAIYEGPATTGTNGVPDEGSNDINTSGGWQYNNTTGVVTYIAN